MTADGQSRRAGVLEFHSLALHFSRVFHGILHLHVLDALFDLAAFLLHVLGLTFHGFNLLFHGACDGVLAGERIQLLGRGQI
jgi:hypothetical protein